MADAGQGLRRPQAIRDERKIASQLSKRVLIGVKVDN